MKIVIDIPEQMYLNAKTDVLCGEDVVVSAIKHGTPLPKGHGRLIDADALIKRCMNGIDNEFIGIVNEIPTIIESDKENEG